MFLDIVINMLFALPVTLSTLCVCPGLCQWGEHPQRAGPGSGEGRLSASLCQPEAGRGSDQEPAAQRPGPLGQAGPEVTGPRPTPGWGPQKSQTGRNKLFKDGFVWLHEDCLNFCVIWGLFQLCGFLFYIDFD